LNSVAETPPAVGANKDLYLWYPLEVVRFITPIYGKSHSKFRKWNFLQIAYDKWAIKGRRNSTYIYFVIDQFPPGNLVVLDHRSEIVVYW